MQPARSDTEITEELYVSVATAETHGARLFTKMVAHDRVHLVIMAYEMGPVSWPVPHRRSGRYPVGTGRLH